MDRAPVGETSVPYAPKLILLYGKEEESQTLSLIGGDPDAQRAAGRSH